MSARHTPTHAKRLNDFVTVQECVKITASMCEREFARLDAQRRANAWYRRLWRRLTRAA